MATLIMRIKSRLRRTQFLNGNLNTAILVNNITGSRRRGNTFNIKYARNIPEICIKLQHHKMSV